MLATQKIAKRNSEHPSVENPSEYQRSWRALASGEIAFRQQRTIPAKACNYHGMFAQGTKDVERPPQHGAGRIGKDRGVPKAPVPDHSTQAYLFFSRCNIRGGDVDTDP